MSRITSTRLAVAAVAACAAVLAFPCFSSAGIAIIHADRSISVNGENIELDRPETITKSTTASGTFDETLTYHTQGGFPSDHADSTASQRSTVNANRITASGFIEVLNASANNG